MTVKQLEQLEQAKQALDILQNFDPLRLEALAQALDFINYQLLIAFKTLSIQEQLNWLKALKNKAIKIDWTFWAQNQAHAKTIAQISDALLTLKYLKA